MRVRDGTFAVTERGKRIPMNVTPQPDGNLVLLEQGRDLLAVAYDESRHAGRQRFTSHFVDCPASRSFRKAKR